jgi:uncharacterized membrane protein YccC
MDEGIFYGLCFLIFLFNSVTRIIFERKGKSIRRNPVRDGLFLGITIYLLGIVITHPTLSTFARVMDTILGLITAGAGAYFFFRRSSGRTKP